MALRWVLDLHKRAASRRGQAPANSLIDRIIIGGSQSVTGKEREIEIVYKIDIVSVLRHKIKK